MTFPPAFTYYDRPSYIYRMNLLSIRCFTVLLALLCHRTSGANPPLGSSGSPNNINSQSPPQPEAGQSPEQWIDNLFPPTAYELDAQTNTTTANEDPQLTKRNFTRSNGFFTSQWTNETENQSYEIRLDTSECKTGVNFTTDIGVYTFTDGHTTNSTTFKDMIEDIYSLHQSTVNPRTRQFQYVNTKYANHTLALAKLAMKEANEALLVLLCRNATAPIVTAPGYDFSQAPLIPPSSLQRLGKRQTPGSYWLGLIAASTLGGLTCAGLVAGVSAAINHAVTAYNVVSVGIVVGFSAIVIGTINRCQAVGRLDNSANRINRRVGQPVAGAANAAAGAAAAALPNPVQVLDAVAPGGREAVVQNAFIAWFRKNLKRIVTGAVQEAVDEAMSEIASNAFGTPLGEQSDEYHSANGDIESCLSVEDATRAAEDLQNLNSPDFGIQPFQDLEESTNEERLTEAGPQCVMQ